MRRVKLASYLLAPHTPFNDATDYTHKYFGENFRENSTPRGVREKDEATGGTRRSE